MIIKAGEKTETKALAENIEKIRNFQEKEEIEIDKKNGIKAKLKAFNKNLQEVLGTGLTTEELEAGSCEHFSKCINGNTKERVKHPSHYNKNGIEVQKVIEAYDLNWNLGNAVKYILRAKYKGNEKEDLEKAMMYLKFELKEG